MKTANRTMQRMRASRSAQSKFGSSWRLARTADGGRSAVAMSEPPNSGERLFRVCFRTVEYFGILLVAAFWLLLFTGSAWGDKFQRVGLGHGATQRPSHEIAGYRAPRSRQAANCEM